MALSLEAKIALYCAWVESLGLCLEPSRTPAETLGLVMALSLVLILLARGVPSRREMPRLGRVSLVESAGQLMRREHAIAPVPFGEIRWTKRGTWLM
jgi:hypothetical protein